MESNVDKNRLKNPGHKLIQVFAGNIRAYRRKNKLSQEQLAELCNLHRTYVGSVERGERNVTLVTIENFAKALGVSVLNLLTEGSLANDEEKT